MDGILEDSEGVDLITDEDMEGPLKRLTGDQLAGRRTGVQKVVSTEVLREPEEVFGVLNALAPGESALSCSLLRPADARYGRRSAPTFDSTCAVA